MGEDGVEFTAALKQAMVDPLVKDRYFTTPLKLGPAGRRSSAASFVVADPPSDRQDRQQDQPGPGRGKKRNRGGRFRQPAAPPPPPPRNQNQKGKGKGKGGKPSQPNGCQQKTPDGKPICFRFNTRAGCPSRNCNFCHMSGVCFKDKQPMYSCSH